MHPELGGIDRFRVIEALDKVTHNWTQKAAELRRLLAEGGEFFESLTNEFVVRYGTK